MLLLKVFYIKNSRQRGTEEDKIGRSEKKMNWLIQFLRGIAFVQLMSAENCWQVKPRGMHLS